MYRVGSKGRTQAIFFLAELHFCSCLVFLILPVGIGLWIPAHSAKAWMRKILMCFPAWWCIPHPHAAPPPFRNEMWNNDNETINDIITTLITLLHLFYLINPTFAFISFSLSPTPTIVSVNSAPITVTFGSSGHALVSSRVDLTKGKGKVPLARCYVFHFIIYLFIYFTVVVDFVIGVCWFNFDVW